MWLEPDPYQKLLDEANAKKAEYMKKFTIEEKKYDAPTTTYPLAQLQKECPEGVNPAKKQEYLSPEDF